MSKLKTLLLLVLAGFILVGCSDPRADDKEKLKSYWSSNYDLNEDELDCAVDTISDSLSDTYWEALLISISDPLNPNSLDGYAAANDINPSLLIADLLKGFAKVKAECGVSLLY